MFGGILIYKRILINQNKSKIANIGKEQDKQELLNLRHKVRNPSSTKIAIKIINQNLNHSYLQLSCIILHAPFMS